MQATVTNTSKFQVITQKASKKLGHKKYGKNKVMIALHQTRKKLLRESPYAYIDYTA